VKISEAGLSLIKSFEGCVLTAYLDAVGIWTVGYGHTGPSVHRGLTITQKLAEDILAQDVRRFELGVLNNVKVNLNQNEFDALVSFSFNVGVNALKNSTLLRLLNDGADRSIVAAEFLRWNKGGDKVLEGLTRRRQAEKALFLQKTRHPLLAHSILANRDTWLKRRPVQSSELAAEEKLFVPKGSAHEWDEISMLPGETHYKVSLSAQPDKEWWFFPPHFKIINDPAGSEPTPAKPKDIILNVPYYSQRDNQKDPMRTCFSSSCAMLLKTLKPNSIKSDDQYISTVFKYGDTTSPSAQISALEDYGVSASFRQDGSWQDIEELLQRGIPVPIGILHKGPVSNPSGGGHWLTVIGITADKKALYVNDPFGDLDLIRGTYAGTNGAKLKYSKQNLAPRWLVESPTSGWYIKANV
jgi:GH24 family phage-related lysozyme (muramidase)